MLKQTLYILYNHVLTCIHVVLKLDKIIIVGELNILIDDPSNSLMAVAHPFMLFLSLVWLWNSMHMSTVNPNFLETIFNEHS